MTAPSSPSSPPRLSASARPRAAYVHVPFCVHRCGYCDFTVVAGRDDLVTRYLNALEVELQTIIDEHGPAECDTIFIGGGTPTYLDPDALSRLLAMTAAAFPLADDGEWTVEANPFGLTNERLNVLHNAGVNRVSLGVQAFDDEVLQTLERDHDRTVACDAVARTLERFPNTSLDLIFGVPGQSLSSWEDTLDVATRSGVPHVSCYGLTFEKGTTFWSRRARGELVETGDDIQRQFLALAIKRLRNAGIAAYELSNYARPGFECLHNENYWLGGEFYGVGPGAASLVQGVRRTNHRSTTAWLKRVEQGRTPVTEEEPFDAVVRGEELVMTALRRRDGLPLKLFEQRTGQTLDEFAPGVVEHCITTGWLTRTNGAVRLTDEGRFVADTVIAEFFP